MRKTIARRLTEAKQTIPHIYLTVDIRLDKLLKLRGELNAALATFAVLFALYTVSTVRDPMARRVKSLNERREQLKAGITASTTRRRATMVKKNPTTDGM